MPIKKEQTGKSTLDYCDAVIAELEKGKHD